MQTKSFYIHGADPQEQARLEMQHRLLGGSAFLPAVKPGWRVLDVGSGTGAAAREVARKVALGVVIGVDMQKDQIEIAKHFADRDGIRNVEFKLGNAQSLDLPDNSFDLVYCRFLLEHVPDPPSVLREMLRVSRPGGTVVACECQAGCCSTTEPPIPHALKALNALYRLQALEGGDPWVGDKLEGLFSRAGFREVRADLLSVKFETPEQIRPYALGGFQMLKASEKEILAAKLLIQEDLDAAYGEWDRLSRAAGATAWFKLCRAQGSKAKEVLYEK